MKCHSTFLTVLWCITALSACHQQAQTPVEEPATDTIPELVRQVQKCSRLYTTEYHIHKIVTHDDVVRLKGNMFSKNFDIPLPLGERKIAIPMNATLKAYIDFSDFSEQNVERYGSQLVVVLPDPKIVLTSSKISQKDIREYVGLVRSHFTDAEMTSYEQQGREAILQSMNDKALLADAQANAARVLVPMFKQMGFSEENIIIVFRKDLNVRKLIDLNPERR